MGQESTARQEAARRLRSRRERELAAIAGRQHGVISREQLLAAGLSLRTIGRRLERRQLRRLHQGVYAFVDGRPSQQGRWMAAVLACGQGALLSHRSAAALWGLMRSPRGMVEVSAPNGRGRPGIAVHEGGISREDRAVEGGIPVTSVARTLFDLAEVVDEQRLERAFEEADRLGLLDIRALEGVCARGHGRRALRPIRRLINAARKPDTTRSPLEDRFLAFCRVHDLPEPQTNVTLLGCEVDAYWPRARLVVESDSWSFHHHRAAFERDRARDASLQAEGYRVVRVTHRRIEQEPATVAAELCRLLGRDGRAVD